MNAKNNNNSKTTTKFTSEKDDNIKDNLLATIWH